MAKELVKSCLASISRDISLQNKLEADGIDTRWFITMAKEAGFVITEERIEPEQKKSELEINTEADLLSKKLKVIIANHQSR